jgi:hypothetical protein
MNRHMRARVACILDRIPAGHKTPDGMAREINLTSQSFLAKKLASNLRALPNQCGEREKEMVVENTDGGMFERH